MSFYNITSLDKLDEKLNKDEITDIINSYLIKFYNEPDASVLEDSSWVRILDSHKKYKLSDKYTVFDNSIELRNKYNPNLLKYMNHLMVLLNSLTEYNRCIVSYKMIPDTEYNIAWLIIKCKFNLDKNN